MPKWVVFPANMPKIRVILSAGSMVAALFASSLPAQTLPPGFRDKVVFGGQTPPTLIQPTAIAFSPDGRVFVAEKSGLIKVFASLSATTPTVFADLRDNVYNYWDRGLLGLALHPNFPATPYVYVLYTFNAEIGGTPPRWAPGDGTSDPCPSPPGPTTDGCTVSGRLSRLTASGNTWTGTEQVLINDWFQQHPSHSIGTILFGSDGALYASGGEGASFNFADYGQTGIPLNPGGDPPVGVGGVQTPPTAEGGALRSQDLRTPGDPVTLAGSVIRIDPDTGAGLPDNPLFSDPDPNAQRIIAEGLRNPFRFTTRPNTGELWVGDVGWNAWEEINRIQTTSTFNNFGWPCYEGAGHQSVYEGLGLNICSNLYAQTGAVTAPYFTYSHASKVVPGESCSVGSSSITGLAFYTGANYPSSYQNALFFADYSRQCIWTMLPGATGDPNPSNIQTFATGAGSPVQLLAGPGGDLFYADINGGKIHRIQYLVPTAAIQASPTSGSAPLSVTFDGSGSTDPDPTDTLSYSWDLNGDGVFGDATTPQTSSVYSSSGNTTVTLRVTDTHGGTDTETVVISVNNSPPVPTIAQPLSTLTWKVGDAIPFSGSATDPQDGTLSPSALGWTLLIHHCPSNCHLHTVQTFTGVATGSFSAPDHEYPSYLELVLTATDSGGLQASTSVLLYPQTVSLNFASNPTGLSLSWDSTSATTPFSSTVIIGSGNSVSAPSPQVLNGDSYEFLSWSDGGAASHNVAAPATPSTYTANFVRQPPLSSISVNPTSVPAAVPSTGTVTLSGAAPPAGAVVALSSSNVPVASVPVSVAVPAGATSATFPVTTSSVLSSTTVTITAFYAAGSQATTLTVTPTTNTPPSVSITSPLNGAVFTAPATVAIQASASDTDGSIARVDFYSGTTVLGSSTSVPYGYNWTSVAAGNYILKAVAVDNQGAATTSGPVPITVNNSANPLPSPWVDQDIGAVGVAGSASFQTGSFSVSGSGTDIWNAADQFHFVYQPLSGDGEIVARVVSVQNTANWAKAGVMIRESLSAGSAYATSVIAPLNQSAFQRRLTTGASSATTSGSGNAPYWVKVVRTGATFTGYKSSDGNTWVQIDSVTIPMGGNVYIGLAVTSHNNSASCLAVFDNVSVKLGLPNAPPTVSITAPANGSAFTAPVSIAINVSASDSDGSVTKVDFYNGGTLLGTSTVSPYSYTWNNVSAGNYSLTAQATDNRGAVTISSAVSIAVSNPANPIPSPWVDRDIGAVGIVGSASYYNGAFTVTGSGTDIYSTSDQFHFVYQPLAGDGDIVARVVSVQNVNNWAKAGVMIRDGLGVNALYAMTALTPVNGVTYQRHLTTSSGSLATTNTGLAAPYWVRITRSGNTFTSYRSPDGTNWTQIASDTIPMAFNVYIGLAVTSHNNTVSCSALFDSLNLTVAPPNIPPTVSITAPANGSAFTAPASVAINVSASDSDGSVTKVDFYNGGTLLGTSTVSPYSYTWNNVSAGNYSLTAQATDNRGAVTISSAVSIAVSNPANPIPSPWVDRDIGAVGIVGSASYYNGAFTVTGSGTDIYSTSDQFHFVYQPLAGDGDIVARVVSVQNVNNWAKAGVMIRDGLGVNALYAMTALTPVNGVTYQRHLTTSSGSLATTNTGLAAPYWVRITRSGNTFTSYRSPDGTNWTQIASDTIPMAFNVYIGLAVTSHNNTVSCSALFDSLNLTVAPPNIPPTVSITAPANGSAFTAPVSIAINVSASDSDGSVTKVDFYNGGTLLGTSTVSPYSYTWNNVSAGNYSLTAQATDNRGAVTISSAVSIAVSNPANPIPSPWVDRDIGAVGIVGSASYYNGAFTVIGSGTDIYSTSDQFHFVYQPLAGDGDIVARVVNVQNVNNWAKAGVMIRDGLGVNALYAMTALTPVNGVTYQRHLTTSSGSLATTNTGLAAPYWVRITRSGNTFTSYRSPDGTNWTQIASDTIPMAFNVYIGLAVTSHNNTVSCSALFDSLNLTVAPPDIPPTVSITAPTNGSAFTAPASVAINVSASDSDGSVTKVDFYNGGTLLGTSTVSPYSYTWNNVSAGNYSLTAQATDNRGAVTISSAVSIAVSNPANPIPSPWVDRDIGAVGIVGSASYYNGAFTVIGSGTDIYSTSDQFHFVYQPLAGDGDIVARVVNVQNVNNWAKAGVMIRDGLGVNALYAMTALTPVNGVTYQRHLTTSSGSLATTNTGLAAPYWVRITRSGNTFTSYRSPDGTNWTQIASDTIPMAFNVYIGLAVTSHNNTVSCSAILDNITKTGN